MEELYYKLFNEKPNKNKYHTADYDIEILCKCCIELIKHDIIIIPKETTNIIQYLIV